MQKCYTDFDHWINFVKYYGSRIHKYSEYSSFCFSLTVPYLSLSYCSLLLPGMEADDQEDTSYGGTKGDRDNSDFTQLESRSKDKAKVKTNYECSS